MTDAFTPECIAQLREILAKVASTCPRPWKSSTGKWADTVLCRDGHSLLEAIGLVDATTESREEQLAIVALVIAAVNTLPAALDEIERLRAALACHHARCLDEGETGLPDGEGGWIEVHMASEYCDSGLFERTRSLLEGHVDIKPRGGLTAGWWANWVLEVRKRKKAEAELSRVKAELDEAVRLTQRLYEDFAPPPSPGCSCHISPPCNDCVEHSYTRELLEEARAFLSRMEGRKDG